MSWIKDGIRVEADYLGHVVQGRVVDSRVKYGGQVQYTVDLDQPVQFRWRSEPSTRVLIDRAQILREMA